MVVLLDCRLRGGICATHTPHAIFTIFTAGYREWVGFFTPLQNAPEGEQTLGHHTCANIPLALFVASGDFELRAPLLVESRLYPHEKRNLEGVQNAAKHNSSWETPT